jgi:hypothetical protein
VSNLEIYGTAMIEIAPLLAKQELEMIHLHETEDMILVKAQNLEVDHLVLLRVQETLIYRVMLMINQLTLNVRDYRYLLIPLHNDRKEWTVQYKIVKWLDDMMMIVKVDLLEEVDSVLQDGLKKYHPLVILPLTIVNIMINLMTAILLMIIGHR